MGKAALVLDILVQLHQDNTAAASPLDANFMV